MPETLTEVPRWLVRRWQGRDACTVLDAGEGAIARFEAARVAWRADPLRPARLHWVALTGLEPGAHDGHGPDPDRDRDPDLADLPGVHRIESDDGAITLTRHVGERLRAARGLRLRADAILLDSSWAGARSGPPDAGDDGIGREPAPAGVELVTALARCGADAGTVFDCPAVDHALEDPADGTVARPFDEAIARALRAAGFEPPAAPAGAGEPWRRGARVPRVRWPVDDGVPAGASTARRAIVVGAGLAGSAAAAALARRGWDVDVLERAPAPARGASGNPAGAFRPHLSADDCLLSRLGRAAFLSARDTFRRDRAFADGIASDCGLLQIADDEGDARRLDAAAEGFVHWPAFVEPVDRDRASALAGTALARGGLWFPRAGWARPQALCARWLRLGAGDDVGAGGRIRLRTGADVQALQRDGDRWTVGWVDVDGQGMEGGGPDARMHTLRAPVVVLANAGAAPALAGRAGGRLPALRGVTGGIGRFAPGQLPSVECVIAGAGYLLPEIDGDIVAGASYDDAQVDAAALASLFDQPPPAAPPARGGRIGERCATRDHVPLAGAVPVADAIVASPSGAPLAALPRLPGLFVLSGYGSRGIIWAPLLGEWLAARLTGEPSPLEADLVDALDPARFDHRDARRGAPPGASSAARRQGR